MIFLTREGDAKTEGKNFRTASDNVQKTKKGAKETSTKLLDQLEDHKAIKGGFTIESYKFASEWIQKHVFGNPILRELLPSQTSKSYVDPTAFMPKLSQSPNFKIIQSFSGAKTDFNSLPLFSADKIQLDQSTSYILNCGGPVWGLDWCPQTCLLAVIVHSHIDEVFLTLT